MSKNRLAGPAIAILIVIVFIAWMMSGRQDAPSETTQVSQAVKSLIPTVQVVSSQSQTVKQVLKINGVTEANRFVTVRSEANGKVTKLYKSAGDSVKAGDLLVQLDLQDLPARLRQAKAFQEQTRLEYEGSKKLANQGLQNETQLAAALANHEQAKAQLASLELALKNTEIRAPFAGQIEQMNLELGSFVRQGDAIADIYDFSRLTFVGAVAEKDIASVQLKQSATIELINGESLAATVSYIGTVTNPATRTFTVELDIPTATRKVSGVTSVANINLEDTRGHYISPALLFINDDGLMGLKLLDEDNRVLFREVSIIHSDTHGVWIEGLPEAARIIVVGQGFVNVGDETAPTEAEFTPGTAVGL